MHSIEGAPDALRLLSQSGVRVVLTTLALHTGTVAPQALSGTRYQA